jgi:hypothetical protein
MTLISRILCSSYQLYFTHLKVYSSCGCENIHLASKPPVTMDSVSPDTIPSLSHPVINTGCSAYIPFTSQVYALSIIFPTSPEFLTTRKSITIDRVTNPVQSILLPWVCAKFTICRTYTRCTMTTPQNIGKCARSRRNVGPEPQRLTLVSEESDVRESFEQVRCMLFWKKIQGFNVRLEEQFALSFNGLHTVIAGNTFHVTEETLSVAMEIPLHG